MCLIVGSIGDLHLFSKKVYLIDQFVHIHVLCVETANVSVRIALTVVVFPI